MPGFMQSFKSPFSPNKKNVPVITPAELVASAEEVPIAQEQSTPEVLPAEALVQQTSSTVALTLTPVNGESSQQLIPDTAEVIPLEQPIAPLVLPVESESPEEARDSAPSTEIPIEAASIEPTPEVPTPEVPTPEVPTLQPPVTETDAAVELPSDSAEVAAPISEPETVAPQILIEDSSPAEELASDAAPSQELACAAAISDQTSNNTVLASTEAEGTKPASKGNKDCFSSNLKRNKSKKQKADTSTPGTEAGQSVSSKPRKSHPLADKLRSVIDQVKSKVKKDKEAAITLPAITAVEPMPIVEEVAASA